MPDSQFDADALAIEYRRLGGKREVLLRGEQIFMNVWEPEPEAAQTFWNQKIDGLTTERRNEVARVLAGMPA